MRSHLFVAALLITAIPRPAAAQRFVSPLIATTFNTPSAVASGSKPAFGFAFGKLGKIGGSETEIAYYPDLIGDTAATALTHKVFTFSESFIVGPVIGRFKPYGGIGFGDMLLNVSSVADAAGVGGDAPSVTNNYFTINAGGGTMAFFSRHLGARGDLRYFRAYGFEASDLTGDSESGLGGLAINHFVFWRLSAAFVAKF